MNVWLQVWWILAHGLFSQMVYPFPGPTGSSVTPPPLTGMLVWYIAGAGSNCSGATCNDGDSQDTWADQSGNGLTGHGDNTLALGTAVPNCIAGVYHTNQINGKPAVTFNGNVLTPTCFAHAQTGIINTHTATAFVVMTFTSACTYLTGATECSIQGGVGGSFNWEPSNSSGNATLNKACQAFIASSTSTTSSATWYQMNIDYDDSTGAWAMRTNRAGAGSGTNTQTLTGETLGIGGNGCTGSVLGPFNGQMAEYILYGRVLTGGEITTVETYLNAKYGL